MIICAMLSSSVSISTIGDESQSLITLRLNPARFFSPPSDSLLLLITMLSAKDCTQFERFVYPDVSALSAFG